jgi:acetyltransferase-like isoleucine patch superfamily enzyme
LRAAGLLGRWLKGRGASPPPSPAAMTRPAAPAPQLYELTEGLADGDPCPADLLAALYDVVEARRIAAGIDATPASPRLTNLRVCRSKLPLAWRDRENLLLVGDGATLPELETAPGAAAPLRSILAVGGGSRFARVRLGGDGVLALIGDGVVAPAAQLTGLGPSTILLGEGTTCTNWAEIDCRNGGLILAGPDNMWANAVTVMSDDRHAIRELDGGRRLNAYGGRIVLDRHVWLGEQTCVMGGARIGADAVLGAGSLVRGRRIPANTVAVGAPARSVRASVGWVREDSP